jgi:hypothetical protein
LSNYYLSNHAEVHKRSRSIAEDKAMLESIILRRLGRMRASSIAHRDVSEQHASLKTTPYRANRVLALLRPADRRTIQRLDERSGITHPNIVRMPWMVSGA